MKCPFCDGEFEPIDLRAASGKVVAAKRCIQCNGFWFERTPAESFLPEAIAQYEVAQPNYSLKAMDLTCSLDGSLMEETDNISSPGGVRFWRCNDCDGVFFPRGQLATLADWQSKAAGKPPEIGRTRGAVAVSLVFGLVVLSLAAVSRGSFNLSYLAVEAQPLPTAGPNILTLILLALTYLAGTILAVLGRRLPVIIMGWSVIAICLFGFSILIFGP